MLSRARKAHHKSRAGCDTCKSKKVKCDEEQPCSYCVKRQLPCSLEPTREKSPSPVLADRPEAPSFSFADFSLYRHFIASTAIAQSDDEPSVEVWREVVPELATQHQYLLHELLAVAALHLRSARSKEARWLEQLAAEHQGRAITLFRAAIAANSTESALPLFACSCLVIPYYFAATKDALSLLFNEEAGTLAEWLILIQGCAAITVKHGSTIVRSPLGVLLGNTYTPYIGSLNDGPTDGILRDLGAKLPISPEHREDYARAIDTLRVSFYLSDRADSMLDRKNAALRFPPTMSPVARTDLAARHPAPLIIMAFWCVLLYRIEERWWIKGRVKPLLLKIKELLPLKYKDLIRWPIEQLSLALKTT
ncbi:hypothetical protein F4779DRAFT_574906 [Xylariaceae sp. FL0662B]|nr:hypothetical protein F4779DRAFT_574906 [Xylariaceae sp. FL0662B]